MLRFIHWSYRTKFRVFALRLSLPSFGHRLHSETNHMLGGGECGDVKNMSNCFGDFVLLEVGDFDCFISAAKNCFREFCL